MRLCKYRGKWAVYRPDGIRHSLRTSDREIAEARFVEYKRQLTAQKNTIGEIVEAYLEEKKGLASIDGMRDAWKAVKPFFQGIRYTNLERGHSKEYARTRQASAGTIRKELGLIRQAIRWFDPKAAPPIELPPAPPPKDRYLTRPEYERLKAACIAPHMKLFVQLALGTGARKGALLELTWEQVDLERGQIRLTKGVVTNKRRATVSIDETLVEALKEAKKDSVGPFVINIAGERVGDIKKGFREACKRAGLGPEVTPHTMRHTAAVWMAEAGIPMSEIAQMLGHTKLETTYKVYARYSPDYLKKAAAILRV